MPLQTDISSSHLKGILIINLEKHFQTFKCNFLVDVPFFGIKKCYEYAKMSYGTLDSMVCPDNTHIPSSIFP